MAQGVPGRLRPRIILTVRHYKGGRSSTKSTGRLYPRKSPWYSLSEAESASGHMVLSGVPRKKSPVTPLGIDHGTFRLVAQCLNHYATPSRFQSLVTPINTVYIYIYIHIYIQVSRRNGQNFGRVFLMLKYTDITQNTYVKS